MVQISIWSHEDVALVNKHTLDLPTYVRTYVCTHVGIYVCMYSD